MIYEVGYLKYERKKFLDFLCPPLLPFPYFKYVQIKKERKKIKKGKRKKEGENFFPPEVRRTGRVLRGQAEELDQREDFI